jgi:phosphonate transport system substrate-binding protein
VAGCTFTMRQWKGGSPSQTGVFVTMKDSGITSLEDLRGKVIMLEQPHSTVGHILPLATLAQQDINTVSVSSPETQVGPDEVGYYVSSGGETSMNLLLDGRISALGIGDKAFSQFSPDVQDQVTIIAETVEAPSQLVAFRPDFDPDLQAEIVRLMVSLDQSDDGKALLKSMRNTEKFEELSQDMLDDIYELYDSVKQILQS